MNSEKGDERRRFLRNVTLTLGGISAGALLGCAPRLEKPSPVEPKQPDLVIKGAPDYERFRENAVWNQRKPDRFPDGIVFAESGRDVVDAVNFARETGWKIGIRSGGHNWIGNHVRNEGLLLDLSRMQEVTIDAKNGAATIQPSVHGRTLQTRLNALGYRFPTATCPTVGMGGYLIGGGASFSTRTDGASCYGVEAVDVVLANGELIHATDDSYPEIMWAVRGAGPMFFGVVTRFYLQLKPLPKSMLTRNFMFPSVVSKDFMDWHLSISPSLSTDVNHNWFGVKNLLPEYPGIPFMLNVVAFGDSDEETRAKMAVFDACPVLDRAFFTTPALPWSFDKGYSDVDFLYPKGYRFRSDAIWIEDPTRAGFTDLVAGILESMPSRHSHLLWAPYSTRHFDSNSCYPFDKPPPLSIHLYGVAEHAKDNTAMDAWVNDWLRKLQKFSVYGGSGKINDNDVVQFPKYIVSPENTDRLEILQKKYDPQGVFHRQLGGMRPNPIVA